MEGRLWMATYNGALCYYKDDTFHTASNTPFLQLPFKGTFIKRIALESDSSITIVFWKLNKFLNVSHEKIKVLDISNSALSGVNYKILERVKLTENRYKYICADGIVEVDTTGKTLAKSQLPVADAGKERAASWSISFGQNQSYIFSEHYVFSRDGQVLKTLDDSFLKKNILFIIYHNSQGYFFGTNNGLTLNGNTPMLHGYQVSCVTQDKPGNYWATTLENGVFVYDKYFRNTRVYKEAYKGKVQYARALQDDVYFMSKDNNLYDLKGDKIKTVFNFSRHVGEEARQANTHFFMIGDNYSAFYFNNKNGIEIDNVASPALRVIKYNTDLLYPNSLRAAIDVSGTLYVNADNKILRTNVSAARPYSQLKFDVVSDEANNDKIFGFAKAPDNSIWYSTLRNVYKVVNDKGTRQTRYNDIPFKLFGFFGEYLVGYTHNNDFLICSNYNGALVSKLILNQNCIWDRLYNLDADHVLISTNNLYRLLTLSTLEMSVIENPLVPLQAEAICSDKQKAYFFKNGSVTSIDLNRLLLPPDMPKLFFTYLRADKKLYPIQREMRLPFDVSKSLSISFSTLSFSGKNLFYYYSVSKDNDNWQPITSEEVNLVNPPPGYYTVKVKAKTISSGFSAPIVFTLYIAQPFWLSWWFITLCIWSFVAIVWSVIRYRLHIILRKKERLYQTEIKFMKSEYKAMNALMNPHFIFNTLNNVQSLVNANDKVAANEYLRIFADLIRQNMHNVSKELISVQKEVDLVANYLSLEQLRFEDKLSYIIDIEEGLDLSDIMIPPLLIQPLVENSIKHGILPLKKSGIIKLEIFQRDNSLFILVKDNGVGISNIDKKANPLHESFGLENIRKRIEQLSVMQDKKITFDMREIADEKSSQVWTVVSIIIPFMN
jgi:two-component sensor histidine kinase